MEELLRTREHWARMEERREALRADVGRILPPGKPVVLEIGSGHGHFLTAFAGVHAAETCIGIDIDSNRVARANRKRDRAALHNLHFLRAEARLFLEVLPPETRIAMILILFPDPWPKKRHHKHRLLQAAFLDALAERVQPGARLYFRSDHAPYASDVKELIRSHPDWRLAEEPWPFELETVFQARAATFESLVAIRNQTAS